MDIVQLESNDWYRYRRLRLMSLANTPDAFGSTLQQALELDESGWRQQLQTLATFVAVVDGVDAGTVRGVVDGTDPDAAWLVSMWVHPHMRGRSLGLSLVQAVAAWARHSGCARLLLDVADENDSAIALYTKAGFVASGETGTLPAPREHITEHRRVLQFARPD